MQPFKIIIVEDVPLEMKGTLGIVRADIPEAEVIGTASNESEYWKVMKQGLPDLVLLEQRSFSAGFRILITDKPDSLQSLGIATVLLVGNRTLHEIDEIRAEVEDVFSDFIVDFHMQM